MKNKLVVTKASGVAEPFSLKKLRNSLGRAKATPQEINSIINELLPKLYQGISTKKIYSEALRLLRHQSKPHAARYHLKRGMMELGPSGFAFEKFIGELFKHQGYAVQVGKILEGKCVKHEIDVIAEKENIIMFMECKYRNQPGMAVDIKTPLYIQSRFEDVIANELLKNKEHKFFGCITTNAKFTRDALDYGLCKGLNLLSWDYPHNKALKDMIDNSGLYPLTCLTSLTRHEKQWLLAKEYVLLRDLYDNYDLLLKAGVKESRLKSVMDEVAQLCRK
ncbi:MAG: restriction endonuclease [Bacteroidetes bacterium]|nr:restriction endonuclease [Bacteroidota bacterium]